MQTDDLRALLDEVPLIVEAATFAEGTSAAFDVELQRVDRVTIERIGEQSVKKVNTRQGQRAEADVKRFRQLIRDHCLRGWSGLTLRKVMLLTSRSMPAEANGSADREIPFTPDNALVMLEHARGLVNGDVTGFADWVFDEASKVAEREARAEAEAKNG